MSKLTPLLLLIVLTSFISSCSKDKDEDPLNEVPVAHAGADQSVEVGALVTLDGSASSDKDNDALSYVWVVPSSNPELVTLSATDVAKPTFTAPTTEGDYTFQLTVHDGTANSQTDEVVITVSKNGQGNAITYFDVPRQDALMQSVAFGNNVFVAVGFYGNSFNDEDRGSINYSQDGENWTEVATMTGGDSWHEVIFAQGRFVASGNDGAIATSTDGQNWTKQTTSEIRDWLSVACNSSTYVFTSKAGRHGVSDETDFSDFSVSASGVVDDVWYSITYGTDKFVMVGNNGRAAYSADGSTWSYKTIDTYNYSRFTSVTYGAVGYIACFSNGSSRTAVSADGINWTMQTNSVVLQGGRFLNNTYVMLGNVQNSSIYLTSDLDFTNAQTIETQGDWRDVAYGKNKYVVVGNKVGVIDLN